MERRMCCSVNSSIRCIDSMLSESARSEAAANERKRHKKREPLRGGYNGVKISYHYSYSPSAEIDR